MDGMKRITSIDRQANEAKKDPCFICFEDIDPSLMCSVDECGHRFCLTCVKQHIEVKLSDQTIPYCPHYRCQSKLSVVKLGNLLTQELYSKWRMMAREDKIPFGERIYCPNQRCSYLMSKCELSSSDYSGYKRRICGKCRQIFCIDCKLPWHNDLSCSDYKKLQRKFPSDVVKLKAMARSNGWKQCRKCGHMVELFSGCIRIICRCGNWFCYECGDEWDVTNNHYNCIFRRMERNSDDRSYQSLVTVFFPVILIIFLVCALKILFKEFTL